VLSSRLNVSVVPSSDADERHARAMCWRCRRPRSVCYCGVVEAITTRTRVVILQHPRERDVPINTARIAALCLPNSELHIGVHFAERGELGSTLSDPALPAILLFPGVGTRDLALAAPSPPLTLVVVDGTWWQAEKLFKENPFLQELPRYSLAPKSESRYRIRREPAAHCLSTIEAIAGALSVLEQDADLPQRLLRPFEQMVEAQLGFVHGVSQPRHVHSRRLTERALVLPSLSERPEQIVVGYGEANAWPHGTPGAPEPELVHWAATRLSTGEHFEAFVVPDGAIAPSFENHTGLPPTRVLGGESKASFERRWREFLRPTDLLAGWGFFASELLRRHGCVVGERFDVRRVAIAALGGRVGELEDYVRALNAQLSPPWAAGRTGLRLAAVEALVRRLRDARFGHTPRREVAV
jgi:DTW domain-containing protein YfiP